MITELMGQNMEAGPKNKLQLHYISKVLSYHFISKVVIKSYYTDFLCTKMLMDVTSRGKKFIKVTIVLQVIIPTKPTMKEKAFILNNTFVFIENLFRGYNS